MRYLLALCFLMIACSNDGTHKGQVNIIPTPPFSEDPKVTIKRFGQQFHIQIECGGADCATAFRSSVQSLSHRYGYFAALKSRINTIQFLNGGSTTFDAEAGVLSFPAPMGDSTIDDYYRQMEQVLTVESALMPDPAHPPAQWAHVSFGVLDFTADVTSLPLKQLLLKAQEIKPYISNIKFILFREDTTSPDCQSQIWSMNPQVILDSTGFTDALNKLKSCQ